MENNDEISKRYQWVEVDGKYFLEINLSNLTSEHALIVIEAVKQVYDQFPYCPDSQSKIRLIFNATNSDFSFSVMREVAKAVKKGGSGRRSDVTVSYGTMMPALITLGKLISPFLKSRARMFKNREEAIEYVMKF